MRFADPANVREEALRRIIARYRSEPALSIARAAWLHAGRGSRCALIPDHDQEKRQPVFRPIMVQTFGIDDLWIIDRS